MGSVTEGLVIDRSRNIAAEAARVERRRPGRIENISPELIPLLRSEVELPPDTADRDPYDLAAAAGIAVALLICAPIWALFFWAV
jgi:hypothetical protein